MEAEDEADIDGRVVAHKSLMDCSVSTIRLRRSPAFPGVSRSSIDKHKEHTEDRRTTDLKIIEQERPPCPTQLWPSPLWTGPYPKPAARTAKPNERRRTSSTVPHSSPAPLRAAHPSILTPTHPGDGTDHRAIPLFTEVTEHEPYRPMAQMHILSRIYGRILSSVVRKRICGPAGQTSGQGGNLPLIPWRQKTKQASMAVWRR